MEFPLVSILIPCKDVDSLVNECLEKCADLDYPDFEIILLPDNDGGHLAHLDVKVIPAGDMKPATKRNLGVTHAKGEIIAFIDSDAYPDNNWLKNAVKYFSDPKVAAVGGPSLTPEDSGSAEKASGAILSSIFGGGMASHRYRNSSAREDDDLPTCNLILHRSVLDELGGFDIKYWPGEDTYLCRKIVHDSGLKILYAPDVVVYHHRHPLVGSHLRQIWSYGLHRGYFFKVFPENSRRIYYLLPTLFLTGLIASPSLSILYPSLTPLLTIVLLIYAGACIIEGLRTRGFKAFLLVTTGIFLTHITYGLAFLIGLLSRRLD